MPFDPAETLYYRQTRFSTRLPTSHLYSPSHYWLARQEGGRFRVGLTKFAMRMLGDFVEHDFSVSPSDAVEAGDPIGWIEGFKALSDIYCVSKGVFLRGNPNLAAAPQLVDKDPYDGGWLYEYEGEPPVDGVDAAGYVEILDATITRMLAEQQNQPDKSC
ncbi:Glycine cleavage system H protein [Posidoniimonas polymericola]|uniref:Glycine cleavage system H protein n=1 Tax=Posidoniimonas polymericola TaxID=2528002 RepID=A0A5C5YL67_9BACT|nr:glycine cleavage system protein H [Posidoniimonas polymericola]TWT75675.1 Glycine cleavage system H protein [Posidoniimonas polymericola]